MTKVLLTADGSVLLVVRNPEGFPLIASRFAGSYGCAGEVLIGGRIRGCGRIPEFREIRESDSVFTADGRMFPASQYIEL